MTSPGALLEVTGVSHGYGAGGRRVPVLHEVSMSAETGELVALAGPSGSGKSTLCHLLAGFESPDIGTVHVDGRPADRIADWRVVAVVPQQLGLVPGLSASDNVRLPALRAGVDVQGRVLELGESLQIGGLLGREVTAASLGEQQRVAVARALVMRPRLVVLDEPTGHQDDERVATVVAALRAATAHGAVVVASHDQRVWEAADRLVRLEEGRAR